MSESDACILKGPKDDLRLPKESMGTYLFHSLKRRDPLDIVTVDATTGNVLTSEAFLKNSLRLAVVLEQLGATKGDVISIASENTINYCTLVVAALFVGITVNPLNPGYTLGELRHVLRISKPKLVLCCELALTIMIQMKAEFDFIKTVVLMGTIFESHFEEDIETKRLEDLLITTTADEDCFKPDTSFDCAEHGAFIFLSSGTTGLPKGVLLTHIHIRETLSYLNHPLYGNMTSTDCIVLVPPFFHIFGMLVHLAAIAHATKLVVIKEFKPVVFLQCLQDYKATKLFLVPTLLLFLAKNPLVDKYDISSIRDIIVGGTAVAEQLLKDAFERLSTCTIRELYGLTETSGACTMQTFNMNKQGNVGELVPNMMAKVWDSDTNEILGHSKTGELCFKGPMVMKGYYDNPKATQECFDQDGFYHTGDLGFFDKNGSLYIVARQKELIKYKCFQVPPAELEALILTHPGVSDCGVIGIPDEIAGQLPVACVVRQNETKVTEQELVDYVAERISVQKRLYGGVVFVEEIPKTPSGKILRGKLDKIVSASQK